MVGFEVLFARMIANGITSSKKGKNSLLLKSKQRKPATSELVLKTRIDFSENIPCSDSEIVNLNVMEKKNEEKMKKLAVVRNEEDQIRILKCGIKYYVLGKYQHARIFLENVITFNKSNSFAWNYLGLISEKENNIERAKDYFQIAVNFDENNLEAARNLSRVQAN